MVKYRFKKDKWYKYNRSDGYYLKSDRDSKDTIYYSEYISICTGKHDYRNSYYKNEYVTDEEVSLEEVRKYLPEGHPDRFKKDLKLKENVWYQVTLSGKFKHVFKFIGYYRLGKVNLQGGHYDINGGRWVNATCFDFDSITDIKELSVEDIQQYLPENHPDKITTPKFEKRKQKSEFVLPEKWYTKPKTNEEKDVLNKFVVDLKDNHWKIEDKHSYKHTPHFKNGNYQRSTWIGCEDNDYTEITFEQFKKYVLKDKSVASTDKVKYVIATSEEAVFVSSVVESVSISILNVEDSKILPLPKSIESIKTKLN